MLFLFAGKYYLVDAGYPNEYGYLSPYKGKRYHLQDFRHRGQPNGREEVFNCAHSSLRNVIECSFGVWNRGEEFCKTCMLINVNCNLRL
jgi:hypothetical protein